jgi:hypothetical protein
MLHFLTNDAPHIVVSATRAEFNRDITAVHLNKRFEHLQSEPGAVLNTSSPLICALVRVAVKELTVDISVGSVNYIYIV